MKDPKFRIKILAYETGNQEAKIDERRTDISKSALKLVACSLVDEAINKQAYEIILDIFEETEGAK